MKFTLEKAKAAALAAVFAVVPRRTTIPILSNLLLETRDNTLTITATDLDMRASIDVEASVAEQGSVSIVADKFNEIVRALPDGADLTLETEEHHRASVKVGRSRFIVATLPAVDFPMMGGDDAYTSFDIEAAHLARLLDVGSWAAGVNDARMYLNCAYLHVVDGKLRVASTDGRRLAYCERPAPPGADIAPDGGAMLSRALVQTLQRLLTNVAPETVATLAVGQNKVMADIGSTRLVGKLLDFPGAFPAYQRIIPQEFVGTLVIDTDMLLGAARRVLIMAEEFDGFTLKFALGGDQAVISTPQSALGSAREEVEAVWSGPAHEFGIKGTMLLDLLTRVRTENTVLQVCKSLGAGIPIGETGDSDWFAMIASNKV